LISHGELAPTLVTCHSRVQGDRFTVVGEVWKAARVEADHERGIRVAELLVGLSSVADLGMGQPVGSAARSCLVAVWLSRASGCHEDVVADVLYAALLQHVGCTAYSHEASLLFAMEHGLLPQEA
jgi:hypothetical protein